MPLIVEDGSGKSDADAYVSEADANTYFTNRQGSTAWNAGTVTQLQKEAAIRNSTAYLDRRYNNLWMGRRVERLQALSFPRVDVRDYDGFAVGADSVPQQVIDACCEGAVLALSEDMLPDIASAGIISEETVSVASVRSTTKYEGGKAQNKTFRKIETLLRGLIKNTGTIELERA